MIIHNAILVSELRAIYVKAWDNIRKANRAADNPVARQLRARAFRMANYARKELRDYEYTAQLFGAVSYKGHFERYLQGRK